MRSSLVPRSNIILKYTEPAEARKPSPSRTWRLYTFKGDDILDVINLWERSVWLLGREEQVVDVVTPHPSCSGQHAALQFRYTMKEDDKKEECDSMQENDRPCVRLYLIDLDSANSTRLNEKRIESGRYVEIRHGDVIEFGGSKREYVIILPHS
ncbi:SMAD/FHA domain-containing protein [Melanomma pulvis-pyrius CBS 109.77]|uniref:SMAD/FHA domain-containing protein n=1 Tax=Melanomma pulvis-pyrius CBS 109.77 TaxID=1314802 RepID=A0A6A6XL07_9PLEO|nr:SMAD/FHA domain-containing protein [Melanomma pulvis-pyrius CBS 109.77]